MRRGSIGWAVGMVLAVLLATGCESAYYGAWERMGWHKRDILVDRVREARDEQEEAKEQFASALERFIAVTEFEGGDLQEEYDRLSAAYERSSEQAAAVTERIDSVEDVGEALFEEWESELDQYDSAELRRASERQLRETRQRYDQLLGSMRQAEAKMQPVLEAFQDQVLFLKHNLNARAIASLEETATTIRNDVAQLIREMEESINQANAFIEQMGAE